jgi:hypothetical protein
MPVLSMAEVKVERAPLEIGTYIDLGQVVNGGIADPTNPISPDGAVLQRTAVYVNQETKVADRLTILVGVGGLFYYAFPENANNATSRSLRFGPGVGQAAGVYKFGDVENPSWTIQFGYFPYKYNPDSKNLGEYLLRDGTYPGYEVTGTAGWSLMNSALYMASGAKIHGNFLGNTLTADLNFFIERDIEPNHDISPSLVVNYSPLEMLSLGAGVEYAHGISFTPSILKGRQYLIKGDSVLDQQAPVDSGDRFTFQGIKLMARASLNFGAVLKNPWIGDDGLKLYGEAALLGVKDYPVYYAKKMERLPVMVGLNFPTFNFFDILAVEMEYRKWGFLNSTGQLVDNNQPYWDVTVAHVQDGTMTDEEKKIIKDQDIKWTIYAKKRIAEGISIYAQAASDWARGIDQNNVLTKLSITQKPSQWYYLFRLEFGI